MSYSGISSGFLGHCIQGDSRSQPCCSLSCYCHALGRLGTVPDFSQAATIVPSWRGTERPMCYRYRDSALSVGGHLSEQGPDRQVLGGETCCTVWHVTIYLNGRLIIFRRNPRKSLYSPPAQKLDYDSKLPIHHAAVQKQWRD